MKLGLNLKPNNRRSAGGSTTSLLLDLYPGAAAAYALVPLSNSYTGPVVRVRRSSDNAESNFISVEITDGTLTTFCGAGDGFIATWYDQSENGQHVIQTVNKNQPKIVDAGILITQGGEPAMRFDGFNDCLLADSLNPFTFTGGISIISVLNKSASAYNLYETIFSVGTTGSGTANGDKSMGFGFSNAGPVSPKPTITTDIWRPSGIQKDGTVSTSTRYQIGWYISNWSTHRSTGLSGVSENGTLVTTKTYSSQNPVSLNGTPIKIGVFDQTLTTSHFSGDIQTIITWSSDQSANRTGIEAALNSIYSIY